MNERAKSETKLFSLPFDVVPISAGVILRRDRTQIRIAGEGVGAILELISTLVGRDGALRSEIVAGVQRDYPEIGEPSIERLLDTMVEQRLLVLDRETAVSGEESALDLFLWNFDPAWEKTRTAFSEHRVVVVGVNDISRRLATLLPESSFTDFEIVDLVGLRSSRLYESEGTIKHGSWPSDAKQPSEYLSWLSSVDVSKIGTLIATCDNGSQQAMRECNAYAVEHNVSFLPVLLQDHVGTIGPLVVSGETPCLECLRARQNSNLDDPILARAVENAGPAAQRAIGFHPSMAAMLADVVVMQLTKLAAKKLPRRQAGHVIEVDLLAPSMKTRKVLRVPRCSVCGVSARTSSNSPEKRQYMHPQQAEP